MGTLDLVLVLSMASGFPGAVQWVTRDSRWQARGPWNWAVSRELPELYREFNGIDFGHAHLAETLLQTRDEQGVDRARREILDFIFSSPPVPPDEEQVAPTMTRLVWEVQKSFNWTHVLHRSLYDLYASDAVSDKDAQAARIIADYLAKPEAITSHPLDHHEKLWSFPESKAFLQRFPEFNVQIWSYHWLQGAVSDVQLLGNAARQREFMPRVIEQYHTYLRELPLEWEFMPMFHETAPNFSARQPEAAAIFDNLHMLHDNVDDVLSSSDRFPSLESKRARLLELLEIYLHRNHVPRDRYAGYHASGAHEGGHGGHGEPQLMKPPGPRPPSAGDVLGGRAHEPHREHVEHEHGGGASRRGS